MNPETSLKLGSAGNAGSGAVDRPIAHQEEEQNGLSWTFHPARSNLPRGAAVLAMIVLVPVAIQLIFHDPLLVLLGFLLLALPLASYFFPTRVRFDEKSVTVRSIWGSRSRRWDSFRSFQYDREHVRLCPLSAPSRLDPYRGVLLRFAGNRDEVLAFLRRRIAVPATDGDQ